MNGDLGQARWSGVEIAGWVVAHMSDRAVDVCIPPFIATCVTDHHPTDYPGHHPTNHPDYHPGRRRVHDPLTTAIAELYAEAVRD